MPQCSLIDLLLLAMFKTNQPKETMQKTIITENMIKYYLGDDFQKWLPEILTHVFNKPDSFNLVKKEIVEAWEQSQEASQ